MSDLSKTMSLLDTLAGFFARALGHPSFEVSSSFFAVGGDSLGAADVLASIEETFHVELKFRDILEAPTPLRLAVTILHARAKAAGHDLADEVAALSPEDTSRLLAHLQASKP